MESEIDEKIKSTLRQKKEAANKEIYVDKGNIDVERGVAGEKREDQGNADSLRQPDTTTHILEDISVEKELLQRSI